MALLWLLVGINAGLLLTLFCMRFPRLGRGVVRVEVPWRACVTGTGGFGPALSCPSHSQQLSCAQWVLAGVSGAMLRWQMDVEQAASTCVHTAEGRGWIWPLWPRMGNETGSGCTKGVSWWWGRMEQPHPQSLFDAQSRACVVMGTVPAIPAGNSCLPVCPLDGLVEALEGVILVSGLPRPAGIHRVTRVHSGGC